MLKAFRIISVILLLLVAINALYAGFAFIRDPSGATLGISVSWLRHSPFNDFLIPGIVLFIVNGIFNLIVATFSIYRWEPYPRLIAFQGIILTGWIIIQVIFMREIYFLHYILGVVGILLFTFGNRLNVGYE